MMNLLGCFDRHLIQQAHDSTNSTGYVSSLHYNRTHSDACRFDVLLQLGLDTAQWLNFVEHPLRPGQAIWLLQFDTGSASQGSELLQIWFYFTPYHIPITCPS